MQMTGEQIVKKYQDNGSTNEQIRILTQLNGCTTGDIVKILEAHGVLGVKVEPKKFDLEKIKELYAQGKTDREIAETAGVHYNQVNKWRNGEGLPNNSTAAKTTEKPTRGFLPKPKQSKQLEPVVNVKPETEPDVMPVWLADIYKLYSLLGQYSSADARAGVIRLMHSIIDCAMGGTEAEGL